MARELWLLRHGEAEPGEGKADAERRLTTRGEQQSRDAGQALAALEVRFEAVYTSPKVRARDTAALACEALGQEPRVHDPLAAGFDAEDARELLAADRGERILLVGHEPDFSGLVESLTGGAVKLRKGGVAAIRLRDDAPRGHELMVLLAPRELRHIAS